MSPAFRGIIAAIPVTAGIVVLIQGSIILGIVLIVPIYEAENGKRYNSAAVIDADALLVRRFSNWAICVCSVDW